MNLRLTIKTKVTMLAAGSMLLLTTVMITYTIINVEDIMVDQIFKEQLPATLGEIGNEIKIDLNELVLPSRVLALSTNIQNYQEGSPPEPIIENLDAINKDFNALTTYFISAVDNNYYGPSGFVKKVTQEDDWFFGFLKDKWPFALVIDKDPKSGAVTAFINYAVVKDQKRVGVTGLGMKLDRLNDKITQHRIGKTGFVYIINKNHKVLMHPDDKQINKDIKDITPPSVLTNLNKLNDKNDEIFFGAKVKGDELIYGIQSLPQFSIYLICQISRADVLSKLIEFIKNEIIFVAILIVVSLFLIGFLIGELLKPLAKIDRAMGKLAQGEGDLTLRLEAKGNDEVSHLSQNVNLFVAKLHTIISEIVSSGHQVSEKAVSFNDMAEQSKENLAQQKDEVSQIATAINEMSATAQEVANNAEATAAATVQSSDRCAKGKSIILSNKESITGLAHEIDETSKAMAELEANTQNINNILVAIQGIAEQTNLLALNAAIEAARAGEQGRGFAVVADEVRVLSQRTQGSTEEIRSMIETLLVNTDNAVQTMERSKSLTDESVEQANEATLALEEIADSIKKIADMSTQIASAAEEQRAVTEEVNRNVQSVSDSSDKMVVAASEILDMSGKLGDVSQGLNDQVGLFKL